MARTLKIASIALAAALAAPLALAQAPSPNPAQAFEVTAPRMRYDVAELCPAIHEQLPDALARAYNDTAARGMVDVVVTVRGPGIGSVQTLEGPSVLQRVVRRAVRLNVDCTTAEPVPQLVFFRVLFADATPTKTAAAGPALVLAARQ